MTSGISKSLWIERPCEAFVREQVIPELNTGENLVRTIWSGISRGTERLVFEGKVPAAAMELVAQREAEIMSGAFTVTINDEEPVSS